jgi:hypothetical protein
VINVSINSFDNDDHREFGNAVAYIQEAAKACVEQRKDPGLEIFLG